MKYRIKQPVICALSIAVFCTLVVSCSSRQAVICEVPLIRCNELLAIEVMINEKGPFKFMLDTGLNGSDCFLRADVIDQLNLGKDTTHKSVEVYHPASQHPIVCPRFGPGDISIGRLTISDIGFFEDQETFLNRYMEKNNIDGIIGIGLFEALDLVIALDLSEQKFRIGRSAEKLGLISDDLIETVPLPSRSDSNSIGVLINIGGHDIPALLDTGSEFGFMLPTSYQNQLKTTGENTRNSMKVFGGKLKSISSTLAEPLKIGHHTIHNTAIEFESTSDAYGSIGCKMLQEFRIIGFDFGKNTIYLD
jgi:hypothetical protein